MFLNVIKIKMFLYRKIYSLLFLLSYVRRKYVKFFGEVWNLDSECYFYFN